MFYVANFQRSIMELFRRDGMNIVNLVSGIIRPLHIMNEARDNMNLLNNEKFTSQMYFNMSNVPLPPSIVAKEKRRMIAENTDKMLMYILMRH